MSDQRATNSPVRRTLPSEPQWSRRDWRTTFHLWREKGWRMLPIGGRKLGYFWLSTDQLLDASHFGLWTGLGRSGGVVAYWVALRLAVLGWLGLRRSSPLAARLVVVSVTILTVLHLPFAMETRHRAPMIDSLMAALAGGGWLQARKLWAGRGLAAAAYSPAGDSPGSATLET